MVLGSIKSNQMNEMQFNSNNINRRSSYHYFITIFIFIFNAHPAKKVKICCSACRRLRSVVHLFAFQTRLRLELPRAWIFWVPDIEAWENL